MADVVVHATRTGYVRALRRVCLLMLAEYRRAIEAERYCDHLKRMSTTALARQGLAHADIPRRVFDKFYAPSKNRTRCDADHEPLRPSVRHTWQEKPSSRVTGESHVAGARSVSAR